ncbi:MAG: GAF and ANTAR domain-containing protein [Mycobacteriaceae bacterium]
MYIDGELTHEAFGSPPTSTGDVSTAVQELGTLRVGAQTLDEIYARVVHLAAGVIPGAEGVSITLLHEGQGRTAAATDPLAQDFDDAQYENGEGPCLHSARSGDTVVIEDIGDDQRWPFFARQAEEDGARSSLSVALPLHEGTGGAFNIYARKRKAFHQDSREIAEYLAVFAAAALTNASLYDGAVRLSGQLEEALHSRAVIEQAKGIIMGGRRCSDDEAFQILVKLSQDSNRKLRDVAAALVQEAAPSAAR